jgi:hypothetical protein
LNALGKSPSNHPRGQNEPLQGIRSMKDFTFFVLRKGIFEMLKDTDFIGFDIGNDSCSRSMDKKKISIYKDLKRD